MLMRKRRPWPALRGRKEKMTIAIPNKKDKLIFTRSVRGFFRLRMFVVISNDTIANVIRPFVRASNALIEKICGESGASVRRQQKHRTPPSPRTNGWGLRRMMTFGRAAVASAATKAMTSNLCVGADVINYAFICACTRRRLGRK